MAFTNAKHEVSQSLSEVFPFPGDIGLCCSSFIFPPGELIYKGCSSLAYSSDKIPGELKFEVKDDGVFEGVYAGDFGEILGLIMLPIKGSFKSSEEIEFSFDGCNFNGKWNWGQETIDGNWLAEDSKGKFGYRLVDDDEPLPLFDKLHSIMSETMM